MRLSWYITKGPLVFLQKNAFYAGSKWGLQEQNISHASRNDAAMKKYQETVHIKQRSTLTLEKAFFEK